jgi:cold shock protein
MAIGTVKFFRPDKGWGAVSCAELPEGHDVWVHYSAIEGEGFRALVEGERVEFEYEAAQQDSFRFRATRVRPMGAKGG